MISPENVFDTVKEKMGIHNFFVDNNTNRVRYWISKRLTGIQSFKLNVKIGILFGKGENSWSIKHWGCPCPGVFILAPFDFACLDVQADRLRAGLARR
ncbi:MAG: hypothetical protein K0B15_11880 [Lentimicrobium sp.]|nr:hypothetical protein [Lentimicrobium sp.]